MKHRTMFFLGLLVGAVLLFFAVTFQVNFNEAAVVETLGRADESSVYRGDSAEPGLLGNLRLRWPVPIQRVHTYDLRLQLVEAPEEQMNLEGGQTAVLQSYVAWRISDPLAFYRSLRTTEQAEKQLRERLRAAASVVTHYSFDQLTNIDPAKLKLAAAEQDMKDRLTDDLQRLAKSGQPYGVEVESVGIKRIILPDAVAQKVFDQMREYRKNLAQAARSEGAAAADTIVAQASSVRKSIMSFADSRAQAIRAQGDAAATQYYDAFHKDEDFAVFLRKLDTYKQVLKNNTTFMFDTRKGLFHEFYQAPTPPLRPASDKAADASR